MKFKFTTLFYTIYFINEISAAPSSANQVDRSLNLTDLNEKNLTYQPSLTEINIEICNVQRLLRQ